MEYLLLIFLLIGIALILFAVGVGLGFVVGMPVANDLGSRALIALFGGIIELAFVMVIVKDESRG